MTFDKLLTEQVVKTRQSCPTVVDIPHAYGIIRERLDRLWARYIMAGADYTSDDTLAELISVAEACQTSAEELGLVNKQEVLSPSDELKAARNEIWGLVAFLSTVFYRLNTYKKPAPPMQKGQGAYSYVFDQKFLDEIRAVLDKYE